MKEIPLRLRNKNDKDFLVVCKFLMNPFFCSFWRWFIRIGMWRQNSKLCPIYTEVSFTTFKGSCPSSSFTFTGMKSVKKLLFAPFPLRGCLLKAKIILFESLIDTLWEQKLFLVRAEMILCKSQYDTLWEPKWYFMRAQMLLCESREQNWYFVRAEVILCEGQNKTL